MNKRFRDMTFLLPSALVSLHVTDSWGTILGCSLVIFMTYIDMALSIHSQLRFTFDGIYIMTLGKCDCKRSPLSVIQRLITTLKTQCTLLMHLSVPPALTLSVLFTIPIVCLFQNVMWFESHSV